MRLTPHEREVIRRILRARFGPQIRVWLFGSRADDARCRGDIDLYIETPLSEELVAARLDALRDLRQAPRDQRYDLVVRSDSMPPTTFQRLVRDTGVRL